MNSQSYSLSEHWRDAVINNNPAIGQLLGLCPLLAVSHTVITGLALGLATMAVLIGANTILSALRHVIPHHLRIPLFVLVIAALVTITQQLMAAFAFELHEALGLFLALITTNCIILGRVEAFAYKNTVGKSAFDGFAQGMGFLLVLLALGVVREVIGHGTLLLEADRLFGPEAKTWVIQILPEQATFLLAILPPGAFISLGLFIALRNWLQQRGTA